MRIVRQAAKTLSLVAVAALLGAAYLQRQAIYDWWQLKGYTPPPQIAALASADTMNTNGRHLFYVNHPVLENITEFHRHCSDSEQTIVLGCFKNGTGIFIYDVQDNRLDGVHEVTAAHEMLHAAYGRLNRSERLRIDGLTAKVLTSLKDKRVRDTIEQYRSKDPSVVPDELHSVLGTEVAKLPAALETYYKRYFGDRQKIVGFSEQYEQEFTSRTDKIKAYEKQLKDLKVKIDSQENGLDRQLQTIQADRANLENLRRSGNIAEYNAGVPVFNTEISSYNQQVSALQGMIAQYNQIVALHNTLAKEVSALVGAIDTRITAQPAQ